MDTRRGWYVSRVPKYIAKADEPAPHAEEFSSGAWTPQLHHGRRRTRGGKGLTFVGTVVNPKTLRPYMIFQGHDSDDGVVTVPSTGDHIVVVGHGYMETDPTSKYNAPAEALGLPRVHTPGGVADKGGGLGTVLYVGMALVATYLHRVSVRSPLPVNGDGISSGEGASPSAMAWWERAASVGLAEAATYEVEHTSDHDDEHDDAKPFDVDLHSRDWPTRYTLDRVVEEATETWAAKVSRGGPNTYDQDTDTTRRRLALEVTVAVPDEDGGAETWSAEVASTNYDGDTRIGNLDDLARELLEDDGHDVPGDATITVDAARLSWRASTTWNTTESETSTEPQEGYRLPIANAVAQHLVLDVPPALDRAWPEAIDDILDVLVELDLREITDPIALRYFYGLAERFGATLAQLNRMRNRAESAKSYYQTLEFPTPEEADDELVDAMGKHGIRYVNPTGGRAPEQLAQDAAYAAKARKLFPKLAKLG